MPLRVRWDVLAVVVVFVDVLRVYLPSLITVFGAAGSTPAEHIGLYAVAWFVLVFAAIPLCRKIAARRIALASGAGLGLARLALQFTDGGEPQLYLATAGLVAGLTWLIAVAMDTSDPRAAATGIVGGLAVATAIHAALGSVDLMWRDGALAWLLLAIELLALAVALRQRAEPAGDRAPARFWFAIGPAILLWGMYTGNPDYAAAADALPGWLVAAVVTATGIGSVALASRPRLLSRPFPPLLLTASAAAFAVAPTEVDAVAGVIPGWALVTPVAGQLGLAGCLGWAAQGFSASGPSRRGLAVAAGMLGFVVLVFGFYAAYDLGLPNRWVPIVAALGVGVAVLGRHPASPRPDLRRTAVAATGAVAAGAAVALSPLATSTELGSDPREPGLRIAAYNIRMGFGMDGTMSVDEQARALAALEADVITLSEIDRGWLLNGGHDNLRRIAERLGMRFIWAPAADELWGDALLTNLPVTSIRNHPLVQGGPTGAQALEVGIRWADRDITVIATHTQPPPDWQPLDQAEQLATIAANAEAPVIVAGDLNMEPSDPAFRVLLDAGLTDAFAAARPLDTSPGDELSEIDHVLVSPGFTAKDPANPDVPHSDHRPVAVTLVPDDPS